jgi:hypothetical protein
MRVVFSANQPLCKGRTMMMLARNLQKVAIVFMMVLLPVVVAA